MTDAPIGIFDSGVGGLSILSALRAALPHEHFIYYADNANAPYGERDEGFVQERCAAIAGDLIGTHGIKALVVACNTATAAAIQQLRDIWPSLIVIGVEPALKPAVALTRTRRIGVMATRGTLASAKFATLHAGLKAEAHFVLQPCDGLAEAIELGQTPLVQELCERYTNAMGKFGSGAAQIDTLVLGCTHYPFAADTFLKLLPDEVQLVHPGPAVARQCARLLRGAGLARSSGAGGVQWLSSGPIEPLQRMAAAQWA
ncbi:glutamate racemase [Variovorax sp. VNK109]|uniref:glutamate racemase n=1 Tax=Variovorax sp. VNK109 TaxID=3400919 RepID=UPI003C03B66A